MGSRYVKATPTLLTGPIPVNAEVRRAQLTERLVDLTSQLADWQELHTMWGDINTLIEATNETYDKLGLPQRVPKGLY